MVAYHYHYKLPFSQVVCDGLHLKTIWNQNSPPKSKGAFCHEENK